MHPPAIFGSEVEVILSKSVTPGGPAETLSV
jgi:hypothetical protein